VALLAPPPNCQRAYISVTVILVELVPSSDTGAESDLSVPSMPQSGLLILPLSPTSVIS